MAARKKKLLHLPVIAQPRTEVACLSCALCCTYVALEISTPNTVSAATEVLWYLYHERVSVYQDSADDWMVQFETRCTHLKDDNKCGIYATRPPICREYAADSCEVNAEDEGRTFYSAAEFLTYLQTRSKRIYNLIARSYLPAPQDLGPATSRGKKALAPFQQRYRALRVAGQKTDVQAPVANTKKRKTTAQPKSSSRTLRA